MINICPQCGVNEKHPRIDICLDCHEQNVNGLKEILSLIEKGHSDHCAKRQVWGDGECECDLYKKGYDPYAWQNL